MFNEVHKNNRGKCEKACPQHLPIRDLLIGVAKEFEK